MPDKSQTTGTLWADPALPDHRYVIRCDKGFYHDVENCGLDWTFGDRLGAAQLGWKRMSEQAAIMVRMGFADIVIMDATRSFGMSIALCVQEPRA